MIEEAAATRREPTAREAEILSVVVEQLAEHGYERLTVEQVATRARASKATIYRRWPSKAALVVAAVSSRIGLMEVPPDAGSLHADLLALAERTAAEVGQHVHMLAATLPELRRNAELQAAVADFLRHHREVTRAVLTRAVERGELGSADEGDLWDVLLGYLTYRYLMPGRPVGPHTLTELVDQILLPALLAD